MGDTGEVKRGLKLLVLIVERGNGEKAAEFISGLGQFVCYHVYGKGTASSSVMHLLGLGDSQKDIILTVLPSETACNMLDKLGTEFGLDNEGKGIAFTIKLNSIAGLNVLKLLLNKPEE